MKPFEMAIIVFLPLAVAMLVVGCLVNQSQDEALMMSTTSTTFMPSPSTPSPPLIADEVFGTDDAYLNQSIGDLEELE